jgi:hypothetical protein
MNRFIYLAASAIFLFVFVLSSKTLITNFNFSNVLVEAIFLGFSVMGFYLYFKESRRMPNVRAE